MWTLKGLISAAGGAVAGFFACIVFVAIVVIITLWLVSDAEGQVATPTYPATLGEQDHRLRYTTEQPNYGTPAHVMQYINSGYLDDMYGAADRARTCKDHNMYLYYMLTELAAWIAKHPDLGYILKDSVQGIHDTWCRS